MSTPNRIVWIDDNENRERTADDIGAKFVNVKKEPLEESVVELLNGPPPALVILDHVLDKAENPVFRKGSTIAEAIKEKWPFCPVVGVTSADNVDDIDLRTQGTYDALFPFPDFRRCIPRIDAIRKGFALIRTTKAKTGRKLVHLLKPAAADSDRLFAALPDDLKEFSNDASVASRLYRWFNHLIERPGFLFDRLWVATFVGLNETGFAKVAPMFERAKYSGVFANAPDVRWWAILLSQVVSRLCIPEVGEMSWQAGRRLPGIKKEDFSRCYACRKEYPETVAYLDTESDERRPMHLKCTSLHPNHKRELYFEDIRIMRAR